MTLVAMIAGGCGTVLSFLYPTTVDSLLVSLWNGLRHFLKSLFAASPAPDDDLTLITKLISYLRAGVSLDAALENIALDSPPGSPNRARLRRLLLGESGSDFLSVFLRSALDKGTPMLVALSGMEKALQCKRRMQLKARGITGQCRAQAEVLSWLPWLLALAIMVVDFSWFAVATKSSLAWALWALAVAISGLGRHWMKRAIHHGLLPKNENERLEEEILPDFILRILAELSQGRDVQAAIENTLAALNNSRFRELFLKDNSPLCHVFQLRNLLNRAALTGAPIRDDLLAFLSNHQAETESRWEERVQRLPIALLAPLFACFFPASLLILGGLLIPLLREAW